MRECTQSSAENVCAPQEVGRRDASTVTGRVRQARPNAALEAWLRSRGSVAGAALFAAVCYLLTPAVAEAFTIQSPATRGCHEEITIDAWRRTQSALPKLTP